MHTVKSAGVCGSQRSVVQSCSRAPGFRAAWSSCPPVPTAMHSEQSQFLSDDVGWSDPPEVTSDDADRALLRIILGKEPSHAGLHLRLGAWLCWSFCCPPWPSCMIKKQAFGYRVNSSYQFVPLETGEFHLRLSKDAIRLVRYHCREDSFLRFIRDRLIPGLRCFYVSYGSGQRLAFIHHRCLPEPRPTILFSKSRFQDIGLSFDQVAAFAWFLHVNVFVYDYSGYGCSDGKLSEKHLYGNIERIYEYMTETLRIPWQQIIALGSSLGTAATIHLASKYPVGAVILEGSFMSGLRKIWPKMKKTLACCDGLASINKIHKVRSPTLFVHGSEDPLFSLEHMVRLREKCPGAANIEPLVVRGAGHGGFGYRLEYWIRLWTFLEESKDINETLSCQPKDTMLDVSLPDDAASSPQSSNAPSEGK